MGRVDLKSQEYGFDIKCHDGLFRAVAKRYQLGSNIRAEEDRGGRGGGGGSMTLLLLHANGSHKECWEPFLKDLRSLQSTAPHRVTVTDAWSVDCPSHGQAGASNEVELRDLPRNIDCHDYANACLAVLNSGLVDELSGRRLICIGHSAGAITAIVLAHKLSLKGAHPFESMILIEPPIFEFFLYSTDPATSSLRGLTGKFIEATKSRRDIWASRKEARDWFSVRRPWSAWDERVLDSFITFGLRDLPTLFYPNYERGVTLKAYRLHEARAYANVKDQKDAADLLEPLSLIVPICAIFGGGSQFCPKVNADGRWIETVDVTIVPRGSHYVAQEMPGVIAETIHALLQRRSPPGGVRSKL